MMIIITIIILISKIKKKIETYLYTVVCDVNSRVKFWNRNRKKLFVYKSRLWKVYNKKKQ